MRSYLKKLREEKHLTQYQVAKQIGCSPAQYCRIENNARQTNMSLSMICGLAKVFDTSIDYIIEHEKSDKPLSEPKTG